MLSRRRSSLSFASALALALVLEVGCADYRYAFYEGPVTKKEVPTPPPEDFTACNARNVRHQMLDADADGRTDTIRIVSADSDVEICRGHDSDHNGSIDTWDVVADGKVTKRAHDSDDDGRVDQVWTWPDAKRPACALVAHDGDGDGRPDGATLDLCAALTPPARAPDPPTQTAHTTDSGVAR